MARAREQEAQVAPRRLAPFPAARRDVRERARASRRRRPRVDVEPRVRAVLDALGAVEPLCLGDASAGRPRPIRLAGARPTFATPRSPGPTGRSKRSSKSSSTRDARVERPHPPSAQKGAGVEVAAVREVPEGGVGRVAHRCQGRCQLRGGVQPGGTGSASARADPRSRSTASCGFCSRASDVRARVRRPRAKCAPASGLRANRHPARG